MRVLAADAAGPAGPTGPTGERAGDGASRPAHRYSLGDFGLTPEQVDERFTAHPRG
jgi:hypothetical protein